MRFSIIVPTYNEQNDISGTLDCLVSLEWPDYEIIVVDDSSDRTPDIVREYEGRGVKLIRPIKREGRCGARNLGILSASGDVVVILNADVHLPKDFLRRISLHYDNGADYVLVRSEVENIDDLFARYIESVGIYFFYGEDSHTMEWTEGFSCRRQAAIDAGLFPTGYAVPLCAGEDGAFGESLRRLGARKVVDLDVSCSHIAPASLSEFWYIRKGRGQGSPQVRRFLQCWSFKRIATRALLRLFWNLFISITLLPLLWICYRYTKKSPRGFRDLLPFCYAWLIEQAAFSIGELRSIFQIIKAEKNESLQ